MGRGSLRWLLVTANKHLMGQITFFDLCRWGKIVPPESKNIQRAPYSANKGEQLNVIVRNVISQYGVLPFDLRHVLQGHRLDCESTRRSAARVISPWSSPSSSIIVPSSFCSGSRYDPETIERERPDSDSLCLRCLCIHQSSTRFTLAQWGKPCIRRCFCIRSNIYLEGAAGCQRDG